MTLLFWNLWYSATFYALDGRILSISAVCSTSLRTQTMTHNWCVVHMIYIWRYTFRTEDRLLNDKSMEQEPELFDSVPRVNFTLWTTEKCIMEHTQLETNVHGKREYYRKYAIWVSPLTMELFPYNYRAPTTIPWKTNKPVTSFYNLVWMCNGVSYMLLWVKPEEWVVSLLCCGLQWVTAQNHIPSEECTGTSASLQNEAFNLQQSRSQFHIHRMKEEEHIQ